MTDRNANRPGYKQTKVGWIPEEWEVKSLDSTSTVIMGQSPNSEFYNEQGEGLPLIQGMSDINDGKTQPRYWTTQITKECQPGDIILSVRAPVGSVARSIHHGCIGRGVCTIRSKKSSDFTFQLLQYLEPVWARYSQGSTFEAVVSKDVKQFLVPNPPLPERKKIAVILSTWDRAIEQTQKLIKAKRRLKKGLMQQLLTGRMRFPGFGAPVEKAGELPEGWKEKRINQIGKVVSGGTPATNDERNWGGDIAWVTPNEVTQIKGPYISSTERTLTELGLKNSSAQILPPDSIIVCTRATIGDCVINTIPIATNQGFKSVTPDSQHEEKYIYYSILFNKKKLLRLGAGSTFLEVSRRDFEKTQLLVPIKLNEQKIISELLIEIDLQILLLENRIEHYLQQKHGLMQKLFNGEIRPKV